MVMESLSGTEGDSPLPSVIRVGDAGAIGRGVFAKRYFSPGELIETAPVLLIPARDWPSIEGTVLFGYCYAFEVNPGDMAVALGFGSMYNHSYQPNARYVKRLDLLSIEFQAIRPITQGEEITINYNGEPGCLDPMWFAVRDK